MREMKKDRSEEKLDKMAKFLLKDYLANDEPFGVLTRPALEVVMSSCNGLNHIYIVDFQEVHKMNHIMGYVNVNNIIRRCIADFTYKYKGVVVGRVFSGDEIAVLDDRNFDKLMEGFAEICKPYNLGFRWLESTVVLGKSRKYYRLHLNTLSELLRSSRYAKMLWIR